MKNFFLGNPFFISNIPGCPDLDVLAESISESLTKGAEIIMLRVSAMVGKKNQSAISVSNLEYILSRFPEQKFILDIPYKGDAAAVELSDLIKENGADGRLLIFSYYKANLAPFRKFFSDIALSASLGEIILFYALFRSGLAFFKKKFSGDALIIPEHIGQSYLASAVFIDKVKSRGAIVYITGCSGDKDFNRMAGSGADGIISEKIFIAAGYSRSPRPDK